jgi:hypothetical protein
MAVYSRFNEEYYFGNLYCVQFISIGSSAWSAEQLDPVGAAIH